MASNNNRIDADGMDNGPPAPLAAVPVVIPTATVAVIPPPPPPPLPPPVAATTAAAAPLAQSSAQRQQAAHIQAYLTTLRESKDHITSFQVRYYSGQDVADIVEALSQNTYVTNIRLDFEGVERSLSSISPILTMLKSRTILNTVILLNSPLRMTDLLIHAAVLNPNVRSIIFYHRTVVSVQALTEVLEQTTTLESIYLILGYMHETKEYPMEELENAFRNNSSLEAVTLRNLKHDYALTQIMRGLAEHGKIRELNLGEEGLSYTSWTALNAIRYCTQKSETIQKVTFFA